MKYRNEWKYYLNDSDIFLVENKLNEILDQDEHSDVNNRYYVHSLYFDDYLNSCMNDNDAGLGKRIKWRIRYYDDNKDFIRLEKKEKINGLCLKRSCQISFDIYQKIIRNDTEEIIWDTNELLLKEFCIQMMKRVFRPKIIVDYERTAFVELNTNVRITFDNNISVSSDVERFMNNDYLKYPVLDKRKQILEIKFDDILPGYIKKAAYISSLKQTTFSKYYLGRKRIERNAVI